MPLTGCCKLVALMILSLIPVHYYTTEFYLATTEPKQLLPLPAPANVTNTWLLQDLPFIDLFLTLLLILLVIINYIYDWIQRKLMEKRIMKLNQYLQECDEQLHNWDAQQEQLETKLKMVQNATSEYNLLLYLLQRQHLPDLTGNLIGTSSLT